jgi:hypothetical protein
MNDPRMFIKFYQPYSVGDLGFLMAVVKSFMLADKAGAYKNIPETPFLA